MRNSLQTLGRIKKFELDEQQRLLTVQLEREDTLCSELKELTSCYEREKQIAAENPGLCDFGAYTENYLRQKRILEKKIDVTRREIERIRDVMAEIFKERKTYEIVDDNRRHIRRQEIDAKEQKMLDEIGTNAYIKKHQE